MSNAKELAAELAADHPKIDTGMVENHVRKTAAEGSGISESAPSNASEKKPVADVIRDKAGEIFNPKKHQVNDWGQPDFTDGGYFKRVSLQERLKVGVRETAERAKAAVTGKPSEPEAATPPPAPEPASEQASGDFGLPPEYDFPNAGQPSEASESSEPSGKDKREARMKAEALFMSISVIGQTIGGASCRPTNDHRSNMIDAYEEFFLAYPDFKAPPWVAPVVVTGMYGVYCYQQKTFRERADNWFKRTVQKVGGWIGNWRGQRAVRRMTTEG